MWQVPRFAYALPSPALSPTSFAIARSCAWYVMAWLKSPCDPYALPRFPYTAALPRPVAHLLCNRHQVLRVVRDGLAEVPLRPIRVAEVLVRHALPRPVAHLLCNRQVLRVVLDGLAVSPPATHTRCRGSRTPRPPPPGRPPPFQSSVAAWYLMAWLKSPCRDAEVPVRRALPRPVAHLLCNRQVLRVVGDGLAEVPLRLIRAPEVPRTPCLPPPGRPPPLQSSRFCAW